MMVKARPVSRHGLLWMLIALTLFPFVLMVLTSFKDNAEFYNEFFGVALPLHPENYARAWAEISPYMLNSVIVTGLTTAGVVMLSALTGAGLDKRSHSLTGEDKLRRLALTTAETCASASSPLLR